MAQPEQFTNVVWTDDCGCYLTAKVPASVITRCPLHKAAERMREALEFVLSRAHAQGDTITQDVVGEALAEIQIAAWKRARGQEVEA